MSAKFLIVKTGAIGDTIMALPMLQAIRARHPDAHITWLGGKSMAGLLSRIPEINQLVIVDDAAILGGSLLAKLMELPRAWFRLGIRRFDGVFIGHSHFAYRALAWTALSSVRNSFGQVIQGHMLPSSHRHHSVEYVRLFNGVDSSDIAPVVPYRLLSNSGRGTKRIGIAPGGARNAKRDTPHRRWPLASYVELAKKLRAEGYSIHLFGGPTDEWVRSAFNSLDLTDHVGRLSIPDTIQKMSEMACVITHDTGPSHFTSLSSTPLVVMFGATSPGNFAPPGDGVTVVTRETKLPCQPCYDGRECAPCKDFRCMSDISVTRVHQAVSELLRV